MPNDETTVTVDRQYVLDLENKQMRIESLCKEIISDEDANIWFRRLSRTILRIIDE